jgi:hypothetical protein
MAPGGKLKGKGLVFSVAFWKMCRAVLLIFYWLTALSRGYFSATQPLKTFGNPLWAQRASKVVLSVRSNVSLHFKGSVSRDLSIGRWPPILFGYFQKGFQYSSDAAERDFNNL